MTHAARMIQITILAALALTASDVGAQTQSPRAAVPLDPIPAILDAFRSHPVVALGEGDHGNEQAHAFRLSLLRDARFADVVNDIVVEFGSARYQDVMDRFVAGGDVPETTLRQAWQNTTNASPIWDTPIYEEFFRAVREANRSLPQNRRVRVLLGDPPIDWDAVRSRDEVGKWMGERDRHAADLIRREVLDRKRRALIIYGDMHFRRRDVTETGSTVWAPTVVGLLESAAPGTVFAIWTNTITELAAVQADVARWRVAGLALTRGTTLGSQPFSVYAEEAVVFSPAPGQPPPTAPKPKPLIRMEEQFDAILYLGPLPSITMSRFSRALCADAAYMEMRLGRMASIMGPQEADRFKKVCADRLK